MEAAESRILNLSMTVILLVSVVIGVDGVYRDAVDFHSSNCAADYRRGDYRMGSGHCLAAALDAWRCVSAAGRHYAAVLRRRLCAGAGQRQHRAASLLPEDGVHRHN